MKNHTCQITGCSITFPWDKDVICTHLDAHHDNLTLEQYKTTYMAKYNDKVELQDSSWSNKCVFKCAICETYETKSQREFKDHLFNHHQKNLEEYNKEHGETMAYEEMHTCQVEDCRVILMWEQEDIRKHIMSHDGMTLEEYDNKYMNNYKEDNQTEDL